MSKRRYVEILKSKAKGCYGYITGGVPKGHPVHIVSFPMFNIGKDRSITPAEPRHRVKLVISTQFYKGTYADFNESDLRFVSEQEFNVAHIMQS